MTDHDEALALEAGAHDKVRCECGAWVEGGSVRLIDGRTLCEVCFEEMNTPQHNSP